MVSLPYRGDHPVPGGAGELLEGVGVDPVQELASVGGPRSRPCRAWVEAIIPTRHGLRCTRGERPPRATPCRSGSARDAATAPASPSGMLLIYQLPQRSLLIDLQETKRT